MKPTALLLSLLFISLVAAQPHQSPGSAAHQRDDFEAAVTVWSRDARRCETARDVPGQFKSLLNLAEAYQAVGKPGLALAEQGNSALDIGPVASNLGKLQAALEHTHRTPGAWTPKGFRPIAISPTRKASTICGFALSKQRFVTKR